MVSLCKCLLFIQGLNHISFMTILVMWHVFIKQTWRLKICCVPQHYHVNTDGLYRMYCLWCLNKAMSRLKILGTRKATWSKFSSEDPQVLGSEVQDFSHPDDLVLCCVVHTSFTMTEYRLYYNKIRLTRISYSTVNNHDYYIHCIVVNCFNMITL